MKNTLFPQYTNHIGFVIDASGSMRSLQKKTIEVFEAQLRELQKTSVDLNQDTRVSVYMFSDDVQCAVFDMDVMRFKGLAGLPWEFQRTALRAATLKAIQDLKETPVRYGDHSFLVYVLTDGDDNCSNCVTGLGLRGEISKLPENWTVVSMVPDQQAKTLAISCGFQDNNVQIWETSEKGLKNVEEQSTIALRSYMTSRASGVRGTKSFFATDLSKVTKRDVKETLAPLDPKGYQLFENRTKHVYEIKNFVESWIGQDAYVIGSAYYELVKKEEIQAGKAILIQDRANGKMFYGQEARGLLNLPTYNVKVAPGDHGAWRIFVQSTSVNRHVIPGQSVVVLK